MKTIAIIATALTLSTSAFADTWTCILDSVPYKDSPVARIETEVVKKGETKTTLRITKNVGTYSSIFEADLGDKTDDVLALFIGKGVKISFYMDETDGMGLVEGTIKSPVMNGDIKCNFDR